MQQAEQ